MELKRVSALIIFIMLFLPLISAITISFSKETYAPQELLQAQITGDFIHLNPEKIFIYRENKPRPDPVISGLTKQDKIYYFYAVLPNKEGNFSLRMEDVEFIKGGELIKDTIFKNFTIKKANTLSINPGFLFSDDLTIKIKSIRGDSDITAELEGTGQIKTIHLIEDSQEILKFSSENLNSKKTNLKIGSYNIPVFMLESKENISKEKGAVLEFIPIELKGKIIPKKDYFFDVILKNSGNENLSKIKLYCDFNATVNPSSIELLKINESIHVNITIKVEKLEKNLSGNIIAESQDALIGIPVFLEFTNETKDVDITDTSTTGTLSCFKIGNICLEGSECNGEITSSVEGPCCLGECIENKSTNYSWIIGGVLVTILLLTLLFLYLRIRKRQKPKSAEEILRERSGRYTQRMKGTPNREVEGDLDKI